MKWLWTKKLIGLFFVFSISIFGNDYYAIDCNVTTNYSEKTICNNRFLLELDLTMNENYRYMLNSNIGTGARHDLMKTQRKWILKRNRCKDKDCIVCLYKSRLSDICAYPVITGVHPVCKYYDEVLKTSINQH